MNKHEHIRLEELLDRVRASLGRRNKWRRLISFMAMTLVFCVTYSLILPAITVERDKASQSEIHIHSDECYELVLTCGFEEGELEPPEEAALPEDPPVGEGTEAQPEMTDESPEAPEGASDSHADGQPSEWEEPLESGDAAPGEADPAETEQPDSDNNDAPRITNMSHASAPHVHTDACYTRMLTCGMTEFNARADYDADVETESDWEATLPKPLTGVWRADFVSIAESQLGYTASESNYEVSDGALMGYTRYGEWYGQPYMAWNTAFLMFCLDYAGVTPREMPMDADAGEWARLLDAEGLFVLPGEESVSAGDLVFLNGSEETAAGEAEPALDPAMEAVVAETAEAGAAAEPAPTDRVDRAAMVLSITETTLSAIEGDSEGSVRITEYDLTDGTVAGFVRLPQQPLTVEGSETEAMAIDLDELELKLEADLASGLIDEHTPPMAMIRRVPLSAPMVALASGNDNNITIDNLRVTLRSGAVLRDSDYTAKGGNADKLYVWQADTPSPGHRYTFRISFSTSGSYDCAPGAIQIRMPKTLLLYKDGTGGGVNGIYADDYDMSVPHRDMLPYLSADEQAAHVFVYIEDGDDLLIYNIKEAPAAQNGYVEVSYLTNKPTYDYGDFNNKYPDDTDIFGRPYTNTYVSEAFSATMSIEHNGAAASSTTDTHAVAMDTSAVVKSVTKEYPGRIHSSWQSSFGTAPTDADPNDYYYLVWEIRTIISPATQEYTLTLFDDFSGYGEVVGFKMQGEQVFTPVREGALPGGVATKTMPDQRAAYVNGRVDYVLTRHKKSDYQAYLDADGIYTVENKITAIVTPQDYLDDQSSASNRRSYTHEKRSYTPPGGHFWMYKYGLDYAGRINYYYDSSMITNYTLDDFVLAASEGRDGEINSLGYFTYGLGYPYPWTLRDGATGSDPENDYGHKKVKYVLTDNEFHLKYMEDPLYPDEALRAGDYRIDFLDLYYAVQDARFDEESQSFKAVTHTYTSEDIIRIYVQFNGSSEFVHIGDHHMSTGTTVLTAEGRARGIQVNGTRLGFSQDTVVTTHNVWGYRLETENAAYYTALGAYPYVTLLDTERTRPTAERAMADGNQQKIALKNTALADMFYHTTESDPNWTKIVSFIREGTDYIVGSTRRGLLNKQEVGTRNDTLRKRYIVTWDVDLCERFTLDGRHYYTPQQSGVFYDLLPQGAELNPGSIVAYIGETVLPEGIYTYETVPDFRGTGRTMLIVRFNDAGETYRFSYQTVHPWEVIHEFGEDFLNSIAYETGNARIADGRPDDGGTITEHELMAGLDLEEGQPKGNKFIYSEARHHSGAITAASLGLQKTVKSINDGSYSYSTRVTSGGDYSYHIRFATDDTSTASDLILFDSVENYHVIAGANAGRSSEWQGTIQSIDLSQLRSIGIEPVVYYSVTNDFDNDSKINSVYTPMSEAGLLETYDFSTDSRWVRADAYTGDMSAIKAFAVDMRHDSAGDTFVLPVDTAAAIEVFMKAPNPAFFPAGSLTEIVDGKVKGREAPAYNNIFLHSTVVNTRTTVPVTALTRHDYTQVRYRVVGRIDLNKVDSTKPNVPIKSITFRLWGESAYGTPVDMTLTTDANGKLSFRNIEMGTYSLQEQSGVPDYLLDSTMLTVSVDENGDAVIEGRTPEANGSYTVTNEPRIHGDLIFLKRGDSEGDQSFGPAIGGVVFVLSGKSSYGNDITLYATSSSDRNSLGRVVFSNIERGRYTLREFAAAEGYVLSLDTWTVVCDDSGVLSIYDKNGNKINQHASDGEYVIWNEPLHEVKLRKEDAVNHAPLAGAEFRLDGTSDYGRHYDQTARSLANGVVEFKGLEPGTYALRETVPPEGHVKDDTVYRVVVDNKGNVTIDGLQLGDAEPYTLHYLFPNDRELSQIITVRKQWFGASKSIVDRISSPEITKNLPVPVFHLDTEEPVVPYRSATISAAIWSSYLNNSSSVGTGGIVSRILRDDNIEAFLKLDSSVIKSVDELLAAYPNARKLDDNATTASIYYAVDPSDPTTMYWWSNADVVYMPADSSRLFSSTPALKTIEISDWNTSKVVDMQYLFASCGVLSLDLSGWNTGNVTNMHGMFTSMRNITTIDCSGFDTSKVTDMGSMFFNSSRLTDLNVEGFDTSNVTNFYETFCYLSSLTELDISDWDTSSAETMYQMFALSSRLRTVYVSGNWTVPAGAVTTRMFIQCDAIVGGKGTAYNSNIVNHQRACIDGGPNSMSPGYFTDIADKPSPTGAADYAKPLFGRLRFGASALSWPTIESANANDEEILHDAHAESLGLDAATGIALKKSPPLRAPASPTSGMVIENRATSSLAPLVQTTAADYADVTERWIVTTDGDWIYRFKVYDQAQHYYIWENEIAGYEAFNASSSSGGRTGTRESPLEFDFPVDLSSYNKNPPTIRNYTPEEETGSISLTKLLGGDGITDEDYNRSYDIDIYLTIPEPFTAGEHTFGDVTFNVTAFTGMVNGVNKTEYRAVATVSLKPHESVILTGLPIGTEYAMDEPGVASEYGFDWVTFMRHGAQYGGGWGTITAENLNNAFTATNTRNTTTGSLYIYKDILISDAITGYQERAEARAVARTKIFTFNIAFYKDVEHTISYEEIDGVYGDVVFNKGVGTVRLHGWVNGDGGSYPDYDAVAGIEGLPVGAYYVVTEESLKDFVLTSVTNDGMGQIENPSYISAVTFKNTITTAKTTGFTLEKKVLGRNDDDEAFTFYVELKGLGYSETYEYTFGTVTYTSTPGPNTYDPPTITAAYTPTETRSFESDTSGNASFTVRLKNGQRVEFVNLPVGATYNITEGTSSFYPSYTTTRNGAAFADGSLSGTGELSTGTVTMTAVTDVILFTNESKPYDVVFEKVDPNGDYVSGATLELYRIGELEGDVELLDSWVTSDGPVRKQLPEGRYRLTEPDNGAPEGYRPALDIVFEVRQGGRIYVLDFEYDEATSSYVVSNEKLVSLVSMVDEPLELIVRKVDDNGNPVAGAGLQLIDIHGNIVHTWTSALTPEVITGVIERGKLYYVREVKAPPGFALADDSYLFVLDMPHVDDFRYVETAFRTEMPWGSLGTELFPKEEIGLVVAVDATRRVYFDILDSAGNPLSGYNLQLLRHHADGSKELVHEFQSVTVDATDGYSRIYSTFLSAGTYTLHDAGDSTGARDVVFKVNAEVAADGTCTSVIPVSGNAYYNLNENRDNISDYVCMYADVGSSAPSVRKPSYGKGYTSKIILRYLHEYAPGVTVTVVDNIRYKLPESGGMGTGLLTAGGLGLMTSSAVTLIRRRRRRK